MNRFKLYLHKISHWEYWPFGVVYIPIYFVWIYYSIKARSIFFFSASNPSIKNGGFANESKKEIYDLIPLKYIPKTLFFKKNALATEVVTTIADCGIAYPCIAKPDVGQKGLGVQIINSPAEAVKYGQKLGMDFLIQELITYPRELGVFYYRYPWKASGHISGIVYKEFLGVTGDGSSTMLELIKANPRSLFQLTALRNIYGNQLGSILKKGEVVNLVPFGNHARGAKFIDVSSWASAPLTDVIEEICQSVSGFYYGRLDIKYNTLEELEAGKNFAVIEINGAGSEPTHIYDPIHSIFFAWKEIIRHYRILLEISMANHRRGVSYMSGREALKMLRENGQMLERLKIYNRLTADEKKIKMGLPSTDSRLADMFAVVHANENA